MTIMHLPSVLCSRGKTPAGRSGEVSDWLNSSVYPFPLGLSLLIPNPQPWSQCSLKVSQGDLNKSLPAMNSSKSTRNRDGVCLGTTTVPPRLPSVVCRRG